MKQVTDTEEATTMNTEATGTKLTIAAWRNLAMVLGTLAAIGFGVLYHLSLPPAQPEQHWTFGAPPPDFLAGIEYVLFFFCWLFGLFVIWLVAAVARAIQERREMREIWERRKHEPRRF
jgi:hypothetical protein